MEHEENQFTLRVNTGDFKMIDARHPKLMINLIQNNIKRAEDYIDSNSDLLEQLMMIEELRELKAELTKWEIGNDKI